MGCCARTAVKAKQRPPASARAAGASADAGVGRGAAHAAAPSSSTAPVSVHGDGEKSTLSAAAAPAAAAERELDLQKEISLALIEDFERGSRAASREHGGDIKIPAEDGSSPWSPRSGPRPSGLEHEGPDQGAHDGTRRLTDEDVNKHLRAWRQGDDQVQMMPSSAGVL